MGTDALIKVLAILGGLCLAGLAWSLAFLMAGGGEGWVAPMLYSEALFLAYPVVLVRLLERAGTSVILDLLLLVVAIWLDVRLAADTYANEYRYFLRYLDEFTYVWISLWLGWQILILATIAIRIRRRAALRRGAASET